MTAPWAAPARSRWFDRPPPADVTPMETALRRDLLAAVEWAEGLGGAVDVAGLDDEERSTIGNWVDGIDKCMWNPTVATKRHLAGILRRVLAEPRLERIGMLGGADVDRAHALPGRHHLHSPDDECRTFGCQPVYVVREAR